MMNALFPAISYASLGDASKNNQGDVALKISFDLTSQAHKEVNEYYLEIIEEIVKNLPARVELRGNTRHLLSGSKRYDRLPVTVHLKTQDVAQEIYTLNIAFEQPDADILKRLEHGEVFNPSVVVHQGDLNHFLKKAANKPSEKEADVLPTPPKKITPELTNAPQKKTVTSKKQEKHVSKKSGDDIIKTDKKSVPAVKKPFIMTFNYLGDSAQINVSEQKLNRLMQRILAGNVLTIISSTAQPPLGISVDDLLEQRYQELEIVLSEKDLNLSTIKRHEIKLLSTDRQFLKLYVK